MPIPPTTSRPRRRAKAAVVAVAAGALTVGSVPAFAAPVDADAAASEFSLAFDFGSATSPVADGYERVANTTLYSTGTPGLSNPVNFRDRGAPDDLRRDFIVGATTFSVDVPEGRYWVEVLSGDNSAVNRTELAIEEEPRGLLESVSGSFATWQGAVEVTDGTLDVGVARDARLNAVTISDVLPPDALAAVVTGVGSENAVELSWDAVDDAAAYLLTRIGPDGVEVDLGETTTPGFVDRDGALVAGSTYTYTLRQRSEAGTVSSAVRIEVTMAVEGVAVPAAPAGVELIGAGGGSTLSWQPVEGAIAYDVQRTDHLPRGFAPLERVTGTELEIPVGPDTEGYYRWYYRVVAVGAGGASEPSETVEHRRLIDTHLVSEMDTSAAGGGARPLVGDVTGDGRPDIVFMQPHSINSRALHEGPMVAALTAFDATGELLWQTGEVDPAGQNNTQDIPAQVHDIDNDGYNEVIAIMYPDNDTTRDGRLYVFDGRTGEEKWSFDLPDPLARDAIVFVDASGAGYPGEILLKNRYTKAWLVDREGQVIWEHEGRTGHYPWPYDFDGDGREEIMIGYDMLSPDGELLWRADLGDHADTIWIADIDEDGQAEVLLGGEGTSAHRWDTGEMLWSNTEPTESQNIFVGKLREDVPGLQVFGLDRIDRSSNGLDGLFMIDKNGEMIYQEERQTRGCYGTIPELLHDWAGDGRDQMLVFFRGCGEPAGIFSGDGQFMTELSEGDNVRMWHGDFCGSGRDQVIEYVQGEWLRIVASTPDCELADGVTGEPREQAKRQYNFTRYTAGETAVAPVGAPASIALDRTDVRPGDTVRITGSGFGYEVVTAEVAPGAASDSRAASSDAPADRMSVAALLGPLEIGSQAATLGDVTFAWQVPTDAEAGEYTVALRSLAGEAEAVLTVSAAPVDGGPGAGGGSGDDEGAATDPGDAAGDPAAGANGGTGSSGDLAATGGQLPFGLLVAGGLLLALGGAGLLAARARTLRA
ncbi:outer membrane protein assembly factor BamB family protein [Microbacterium radiodurans]|uniref:PQQ-binding-like beta-propeller repeat protein n=1 Tax=Microbacterium radiodurans TaxID=661398 RepID=A0A5J5IVY9_9MICO|nr:PQQ-binding-like beta-propeller repeat protein [Microbacterium radiodurans]KAA9089869.1 PQQ-binding-like beta-propeller repeat protein [Microbacterium radiodurans]